MSEVPQFSGHRLPACPLEWSKRLPHARRPRYRGASLIRNDPLLGPCSRTMPRALRKSQGGGLFLMSEVPL